MGHGATSSGKYYNGCTTADVNKGNYGKLSSDQLAERIELHARRVIEGKPSVVEIALHWMEKHGVEMSYQSEKQWCSTPKNREMIEARAREIVEASPMELVTEELSTATLLNSLAESAKASADNCRQLRKRMHRAMNEDCTPWEILGMSETDYLNAQGPARKRYDAKVSYILKARKNALVQALAYSRAHASMSKEFRENVKQAYDMAKYAKLIDHQADRKRNARKTKAEVDDVAAGETIEGRKLTEVDVDAARKALGYEDNQG